MKNNTKIKILWASIIACLVLMVMPPIIKKLDESPLTFIHIPVIYVYVFILWSALCVLTFIGYKTKWGDKRRR